MQEYEVYPFMKYLYLRHKEHWESTRFLGYINAQANSTKKLKMKEIIKFPWDNEDNTFNGDTSISNEDVERLKIKAKNFIENGK